MSMTGKQLWDEIERLEQEKRSIIEGANGDELLRALRYGVSHTHTSHGNEVAGHRAMLRRVMRRRGVRIPEDLQ